MRVWLKPKAYERRYRRFMRKTYAQMYAEFLRRLCKLPCFQKNKSGRIGSGEDNNDAVALEKDSNDIGLLIAGMILFWQELQPSTLVTIRGYFNAVDAYNDDQFVSVVKNLTGLTLAKSSQLRFQQPQLTSPLAQLSLTFGDDADVYRMEPYLKVLQNTWITSQTAYINGTILSVFNEVELIIKSGLLNGTTRDIVLEILRKKFELSENRADRYADDQVNTLDTQLTEKRQQSLNGDEYTWVTMRDERVRGDPLGLYPNARPSHYARDNQVFRWDSPPEGGHPGVAPGCRCTAVFRLPR